MLDQQEGRPPAKKARVQGPEGDTARAAGEGSATTSKPQSVLPESQSQLTEDLILTCAKGERVLVCSAVLLMGTESEALQEMIQLACQQQQPAADGAGASSSNGTPATATTIKQLSMQADNAADWLMALKLMYPHKTDRSIQWASIPGLLRLCDKYALSRPLYEAEDFITRKCKACTALRKSHTGSQRGRPWGIREGVRAQPDHQLGYEMPSLANCLELLGLLEQVQLQGAFNALYELVLQATTMDLPDRHAQRVKRCPAVTWTGSDWLQQSVQEARAAGIEVESKLSGGLARKLLSDTLEVVSRYARMQEHWRYSGHITHNPTYIPMADYDDDPEGERKLRVEPAETHQDDAGPAANDQLFHAVCHDGPPAFLPPDLDGLACAHPMLAHAYNHPLTFQQWAALSRWHNTLNLAALGAGYAAGPMPILIEDSSGISNTSSSSDSGDFLSSDDGESGSDASDGDGGGDADDDGKLVVDDDNDHDEDDGDGLSDDEDFDDGDDGEDVDDDVDDDDEDDEDYEG